MSGRSRSNPHAVLGVLVLLSGLFLAGDAAAEGYLTDAEGVALQYLGASVAYVPDMNGDGRDELLVGLPGDNRNGMNSGAVLFYFGGSLITGPDRVWVGVSQERLGWSVAWIGDVDDDGRPDFALGAPNYSVEGTNKGRVFVFYGGANPPASGDAQSRADEILVGEVGEDQFGYSLAAAGDFDNDGADDLIVGAPYSNKRAAAAGAAYVIYGSGSGVDPDLALATVFTGQVAGDHLGWSVTAAGNFLGGNAESVAVGAPGNNLHGGMGAGAVFVYEGTFDTTAPDTSIDFAAGVSSASKASSAYGWSVRGRGRWDNDSYDDLAVGAPFCDAAASDAGRVEIIYGDPAPDPTGDRALDGATAGSGLGHGLDWAASPTVSRDDLLIGAPWFALDGADAGRAYIWENGSNPGAADGAVQLPVTPLMSGTAPDDLYGFWVAGAGDFDGDGLADHAVAAPTGNDIDNIVAGYVHLMDSSGGVVANLLSSWQATWADPEAVRLEFALGPAVRSLRLVRLADDTAVVLWDGPPAVEDGLRRVGEGFVFLDAEAPAGLPLSYELTVVTAAGTTTTMALAGPAGSAPSLPAGLTLGAVWPNPANPAVTIRYRGTAGETVSRAIFDLRGHLVRDLGSGAATGQWESVTWNGRNDEGGEASSGAYLVLLRTASGVRAGRLTLAR